MSLRHSFCQSILPYYSRRVGERWFTSCDGVFLHNGDRCAWLPGFSIVSPGASGKPIVMAASHPEWKLVSGDALLLEVVD
jgi:hypothetical protein